MSYKFVSSNKIKVQAQPAAFFATQAKEEAIRHEIVSLGERIAELKAQRDRAAEHRSKQEEAATLMPMFILTPN